MPRGRSLRPTEKDVDGPAVAAAAIERHQKLFPDGWGIPEPQNLLGVAAYLARSDRPFDAEVQLQDAEELFNLLFAIDAELLRLRLLAFEKARDKGLPTPMSYSAIAPLIGVSTRTGAETQHMRLRTAGNRYINPEERVVPQTARAVRKAAPKLPKANPKLEELRAAAIALLNHRDDLLTDEDVDDDLDTIVRLLDDGAATPRAQDALRTALADVCSGVRGLSAVRTDENQVVPPTATDAARRALLRVDKALRAEDRSGKD